MFLIWYIILGTGCISKVKPEWLIPWILCSETSLSGMKKSLTAAAKYVILFFLWSERVLLIISKSLRYSCTVVNSIWIKSLLYGEDSKLYFCHSLTKLSKFLFSWPYLCSAAQLLIFYNSIAKGLILDPLLKNITG